MTFLHNDIITRLGDDSLAPTTPTVQCQGDQYEMLLELQTDFFGYETSWELRDSIGAVVADGGKVAYLRSHETYSFKYCLPKEEYTLEIEDSYQDGMCCQHSNGSYTVKLDGQLVAAGGSFQSSVTVNFGTTPPPTDGPTSGPTPVPTTRPTSGPTSGPTSWPTSGPTSIPTSGPTRRPTFNFFTPSDGVGFDGPRFDPAAP
mmetsp:Transcript_8066/g.19521  ORF Transcript_8066/g.19521 Transcript_8066/m.19521 type:complete len:202 (+) Transcript_8066:1590-2195(+)